MTRDEVISILGNPYDIQRKDESVFGAGRELLIYFKRLDHTWRPYPMLWVHLKDGVVEEIYAKRHRLVDSVGVFGVSKDSHFETADFEATFPKGAV